MLVSDVLYDPVLPTEFRESGSSLAQLDGAEP